MDGVCGIFAYKDSAWMAREAKRILRAARICASNLYLAGRELFTARTSFICGRISNRISKKEKGEHHAPLFLLMIRILERI